MRGIKVHKPKLNVTDANKLKCLVIIMEKVSVLQVVKSLECFSNVKNFV